MSSASVSITVDGEDQFKRIFSRMDAVFDDLSPIWPDVRDEFWKIQAEQFESEGSKGAGGRWKELSARYAAQKIQRYGPGLKILEATGELRESLTGDNPGSYYWADKKEIAVGTTLARGMYHHRGSGNLPKREVISFSDTQKRRMMKVIQASLITELRRGNYYVPVFMRDF